MDLQEPNSSTRLRTSTTTTTPADSTTRLHFNPKQHYSVTSSEEDEDDDVFDGLEGGGAAMNNKRFNAQVVDHGHVVRVKRFAESYSSLVGSTTKEPWVPAPGKSTRPRSIGTETQSTLSHSNLKTATTPTAVTGGSTILKTNQSCGIGDGHFDKPRPGHHQRQRHHPPPPKKQNQNVNNIDSSHDNNPISLPEGESLSLTGYTLQSKDSLVDVAACLNARREEVLKLWQQNISNVSIVADVEKANQLAIEAAKDVSELRKSIQDLQHKSTLTQQDSEGLNQLRSRILTKLELFEKTHSEIQQNLSKIATASKNHSSTTTINLAKANQSCQTSLGVGFDDEKKVKQNDNEIHSEEDDDKRKQIELRARPGSESINVKQSKSHKSIPTTISSTSLIYLKNKDPQFSDQYEISENDVDYDHEMLLNYKKNELDGRQRSLTKHDKNLTKISEESLTSRDTRGNKIIRNSVNSVQHQIKSQSDLGHGEASVTTNNEMPAISKNESPRFYNDDSNAARGVSTESLINVRNQMTSPRFHRCDEFKNSQAKHHYRHHHHPSNKHRHPGKKQISHYPAVTTTASEDNENGDYEVHKVEYSYSSDYDTPDGAPTYQPGNEGESSDLNYYRLKLQRLHKKLLDQDMKYEELTNDVQKFESQSGFDLMLFKSTMMGRLEELEPYPELLQLTEKRLAETLQDKFRLEADNQLKAQELTGAKSEIDRLSKELHELKLTVGNVQEKYGHLEKNVDQKFKHTMGNAQGELDLIQRMIQKGKVGSSDKAHHHHDHHDYGSGRKYSPCSQTKITIYEDRIAELKRELKKERKNLAVLKDSKNSQSHRMSQRLDQVMQSLEESRNRNRTLVKQLRFIQESYHNIFPSVRVPLFLPSRQPNDHIAQTTTGATTSTHQIDQQNNVNIEERSNATRNPKESNLSKS